MRKLPLSVVLVGLSLTSFANADFVGNTISATYHYPDSTTIYTGTVNAVVGAGVEYQPYVIDQNAVNIDVSGHQITLSNFTSNGSTNFGTLGFSGQRFGDSNTFNGFEFSDTNGTIDDIVSVTIDPISNMGNLDGSQVTFDADHIFLNWGGDTFSNSTVVALDVQFAGEQSAAAPLPAPIVTAGVLFLGVLGYSRLRKARLANAAIV